MSKYLIWGYNPSPIFLVEKELYASEDSLIKAKRILSDLRSEGVRYDKYCIEDCKNGRIVKSIKGLPLFRGLK